MVFDRQVKRSDALAESEAGVSCKDGGGNKRTSTEASEKRTPAMVKVVTVPELK